MSLLELLTQTGGASSIDEAGARLGLSPDQMQSAIAALTPALAGGFKRGLSGGALAGPAATADAKGPEGTLAMGAPTASGDEIFSRMFGPGAGTASSGGQVPGQTFGPGDATVSRGNDILGQIFGSKEVSRSVAADAAAKTGIGADQLKALLPVLAALAASAMSSRAGAGQGGLDGLLSMLDRDGDGSALDDIMAAASNLLRR